MYTTIYIMYIYYWKSHTKENNKKIIHNMFIQPRPSGEKIAAIAEKLDLKKNVVRVSI